MKVLIIGGTHSVGPHVVRRLVEAGHEVTVFHRGTTESKLLPPIRHIRSPLAGWPVISIPDEVRAVQADVVLHMGPMGEADGRAAAEAFSGCAERIVGISSGDVYL